MRFVRKLIFATKARIFRKFGSSLYYIGALIGGTMSLFAGLLAQSDFGALGADQKDRLVVLLSVSAALFSFLGGYIAYVCARLVGRLNRDRLKQIELELRNLATALTETTPTG